MSKVRGPAERLEYACAQLARLYPLLFTTEALARIGATSPGRSAESRHATPIRLDVLDFVRDLNRTVLQLRADIVAAMGYAAVVYDAGYAHDPAVADALDWIASAAYTLEEQGLTAEVLGTIAGLLPTARHLLGLAERRWPFPDLPCPVVLAGVPCGGHLVGLPHRGLVVCSACAQRWLPPDWETLGRASRALAAATSPAQVVA